ncbi:MAG: TetR family transcriptional regulator [Solirubrobacteraceae bacterium]
MNARTPDKAPAARKHRSQAERRQHTRRALMEAALLQIESGESFDALSLRSVAKAAGVVPTAFYRHFASMDELGLALVEESFRALRAMLRDAREGLPPKDIIRRSVEILMEHVRQHRPHFVFVVRVGYTGNVILRHAVRNEVRLFTSELATDLARFPLLREWTTGDLQMLAGLLVNTMIATVGAMLDVPVAGPEAEAEIALVAEKQLRLTMLGVPQWRSDGGVRAQTDTVRGDADRPPA